jgi:hypothetical protein
VGRSFSPMVLASIAMIAEVGTRKSASVP